MSARRRGDRSHPAARDTATLRQRKSNSTARLPVPARIRRCRAARHLGVDAALAAFGIEDFAGEPDTLPASVDASSLPDVTADRDRLLSAYGAVVPLLAHELVGWHEGDARSVANRLAELSAELPTACVGDLSEAIVTALDDWADQPNVPSEVAA